MLDREGEDRLLSAVRRASFEDERLAVISLGTQHLCLTSEQARGLMQEMAFNRGRLDVLDAVAPRIVDRERAFVLLDALTFSSDQREAREVLVRTPVAPECRLTRA
jgi:hypothetical protein